MNNEQKHIQLVFYRSTSGREPVREWLKSLSVEDRRIIGADLKDVEYGWPVGMPLCRPISSRKGLWEVRSNLPGGRIVRVLFCIAHSRLVALQGFIKKSQKTPDRDLDLATKRMKEGD